MSKTQVPIIIGGVIGGAAISYFVLSKNNVKGPEIDVKKIPDIVPPPTSSTPPHIPKEIESRIPELPIPSIEQKSVEVFKQTSDTQIIIQPNINISKQIQPNPTELSVSNSLGNIIFSFLGNVVYFGCYVVIGASLYYLSSKLYTEEVLRLLAKRRKIETPVWKLKWIHRFLFSPHANQLDLPILFEPDVIGDSDLFGSNLLLIAAQRSDFNMIEFLIEEGADIHCTNESGKTFLHYFSLAVAKSGNWELMNLVKKSPKYPVTDKQLRYWIEFAVKQKKEIAELKEFIERKNEDELDKRWLVRWVKQKFPSKYLRFIFGVPDSLV